MLATRVKTAVVLFLVMGGAVFYLTPTYWAMFSSLMVSIAAWEFGGMAKLTRPLKIGLVCVMMMAEYAIFTSQEAGFLSGAWGFCSGLVIVSFWLLAVPLWLRYKWTSYIRSPIFAYVLGVLLFVPTWQGLVFFFTQGAWALLALLAIVWIADIAAYFIGKTWGHFRPNPAKLAPSISPGKSWAGACGAVVAVLLYLVTYFMASDTFFGFDLSGNKNQTVTLFGLFIFSLVITAVSIMGDLLESWFKRAANLKDSGTILPGHGGVYDRIDSMVAVVSVALGLYLLAFQ